ncbi:hypothetical protein PGTUg99_009658 [Puccinia graminis f. sp. tritici]|uniref:F-box domain-containing protein n=1 Tax=Puccinia graminis f. sp. tritici TaxID=56615 RepID=A0A5B0M8L9_PUCGR|nr:hypothetical protein PGTUg99_009658 [Puccinia graminis f. sp. tritici]
MEIKTRIAEFLYQGINDWNVSPLFNLSLVDRTFAKICRPLNWKKLDLCGENLDRLAQLFNEVLPNQAPFVRQIDMKVFMCNLPLITYLEPSSSDREARVIEESYSTELSKILQVCKNVERLDAILEPAPLDDRGDLMGLYPTSKVLKPISALCGLTFLKLQPCEEYHFTEQFLVSLIKDMPYLRTFCCESIPAAYPFCDFCKCERSTAAFPSPLGVHLASLSSLRYLELNFADCFDSSWCKIPWEGALKGIKLGSCDRASFWALYDFYVLFKDSLEDLSIIDMPFESGYENTDQILSESYSKNCLFSLPRLRRLLISNSAPIDFVAMFRECRHIQLISLKKNEVLSFQDIKGLIDSAIWKEMKQFTVNADKYSLNSAEIVGLLNCNSSSKADVSVELIFQDESEQDLL